MPDDVDRLAAQFHIKLDGFIDLVDAAKLIPMKQGTLRRYLNRHKQEFGNPIYRRGGHRRKYRLITVEHVRQIRLTMQST